MSENTNTERDYPELPNFDSGDESIWEAIFNWQTAQPGADAHRKSLAVEAAIISTLHAYVDEDRKARASLSLPAAGQEPVATVFTMEALAPGGGVKYHATIHKPVPAGTKLYAAPQPAVAAGWVSVKDRLPPPYTEVLIYPRPTAYCCEGEVDTQGQWHYDEYETGFGNHHIKCNVTHWMPLPPAPSTEGEARG